MDKRYDSHHREDQTSLSEALAPRIKRDKPSIDHLENAIKYNEAGKPYMDLQVGDSLVIERHTQFLPGFPWLDTKVYYVNEIDQETGNLKLFFEELQQHAKDNFVIGLKFGSVYKKAPAIGRWDATPRFKAEPSAPVVVKPSEPEMTEYGEVVKKKRGRPKGSKNGQGSVT